jgi:hypothetical protein
MTAEDGQVLNIRFDQGMGYRALTLYHSGIALSSAITFLCGQVIRRWSARRKMWSTAKKVRQLMYLWK